MKNISAQHYIQLTEILAKCQDVKRMIQLPSGELETDSHHAFSLAIMAYDFSVSNHLQLDLERVLMFALVHDLLEIITGDEPTLTLGKEALKAKHRREKEAEKDFRVLLGQYPEILALYDSYERLDSPEAATVFVLDKTCTIWKHFHNNGEILHQQSVIKRPQIEEWYEVTTWKIADRLRVAAPVEVMELFEESYRKMHEELFDE